MKTKHIVSGVAAALTVAAVGAAAQADKPGTARLTVVAPADMPFRTLGLKEPTFVGGRTFNNVAPGQYLVVQVPPVDSLQISCSDGELARHTLVAGDNVVCTYTR